jgi:hypothetical protein
MISEHSKEAVAFVDDPDVQSLDESHETLEQLCFGGRGITLNLLEALKPPSLSLLRRSRLVFEWAAAGYIPACG